MAEWLKIMLPVAMSVLLAGATGALSSALAQPRRLRREIADDAAVLPALRGAPRGLIARAMHENAIRLAAWRQYPAMNALDWFKVLVLVVALGVQVAITWSYATHPDDQGDLVVPESYLGLLLPFLLALGAWTSFNRTWLWRREDRIEMIHRYGVSENADLRLFWSHVTMSFSTLVGTAVVFGVAVVQWLTINEALEGPRWINAGVVLVMLLGAPLYLTFVHPHHRRPMSWAERHERQAQAVAESLVRAQLTRRRRRELGLRWWQRLPSDEQSLRLSDDKDVTS
jgi:hypothetical protein